MLILPLVLQVTPSLAIAQEAPSGKALFEAACKHLQAGGVQVQGKVHLAKQGGLGGGQVIVIQGGAEGGEAFEGDFEAYLDQEGHQIIVSKSKIPGFGIYLGGDRLVQVNYDRSPLQLNDRLGEFEGLLDPYRLWKYGKKAEWKVEAFSETGAKISANISKRLIPKDGSGIAFAFGPQIMRIEFELKLDAGGKPVQAKVAIVRSDPMAHIREQMENGELQGGSSIEIGGPPQVKEEDLKEGDTTRYILRFKTQAPSPGILAFKKTVTTLQESREF
ncbi:MAG: hypothetical protein DWQ01_05005 [Planctomycetota bacterium]|nr:MAG: hypothetical protein DWQ01_05005 [Planctomycetota bacterium]